MRRAAEMLECPYCGEHQPRADGRPHPPRRLVRHGAPELTQEPAEVQTMPYVRDVGTFDPSMTDNWAAADRGTWIGSDFLPALRFDRRFGILTSKDGQWPRVVYRVEKCRRCLHHFDAYYSFHPAQSLADQFPHLFAEDDQPLVIPDHLPLPGVFVDRMDLTSSEGSRGIAVAVTTWWVLGAIAMALGRLVIDRFSWLEYVLASAGLLLGLVAAGVLVRVLQRLLDLLSDLLPMDRVIFCDGVPDSSLRRANRVRHWISFTRCRFTGRPATDQTLRTATELLGGVTAVLSLVVVILLTGDLTTSVIVPRVVDAFWWFPVAYMLGSSLQLGATTVHYVLAGLTRVPLRLDEFHPLGDLPALRAIQRYVKVTGTTVAILLITLLAANAALRQVLGEDSPVGWVDQWFLVIVLLGLVSLGLTHERSFLVLAVAATAGILALHAAPDLTVPLPFTWSVDPVTLWLGLVFTAMLLTETRTTNRLVDLALRNTLEARAARLLRHADHLDPVEVARHRATLEAARVVIKTRSGVPTSAAWFPLVIGAVLPAALEMVISAALTR